MQLLRLPSGGAVLPAGSAAAIAQMRVAGVDVVRDVDGAVVDAAADSLTLIANTDVVAGLHLLHRGEDDDAGDVDGLLKLHQLHSC